jgi:hypothetical protein
VSQRGRIPPRRDPDRDATGCGQSCSFQSSLKDLKQSSWRVDIIAKQLRLMSVARQATTVECLDMELDQ